MVGGASSPGLLTCVRIMDFIRKKVFKSLDLQSTPSPKASTINGKHSAGITGNKKSRRKISPTTARFTQHENPIAHHHDAENSGGGEPGPLLHAAEAAEHDDDVGEDDAVADPELGHVPQDGHRRHVAPAARGVGEGAAERDGVNQTSASVYRRRNNSKPFSGKRRQGWKRN